MSEIQPDQEYFLISLWPLRPLVMLDEPTDGVAAEAKFPIMNLMIEVLGNKQVTIPIIQHDMDIVTRY